MQQIVPVYTIHLTGSKNHWSENNILIQDEYGVKEIPFQSDWVLICDYVMRCFKHSIWRIEIYMKKIIGRFPVDIPFFFTIKLERFRVFISFFFTIKLKRFQVFISFFFTKKLEISQQIWRLVAAKVNMFPDEYNWFLIFWH